MLFSKSNILATALLGASAVNAHLIMTNPTPYGKDSLNNSPLAADGSDFPCKQRSGVYDVTEENTYSIGDSIPLNWQGSATHGGGSCQISLTTERKPTKDTNWMVIKSFEGGCPINTQGNIGGGETGQVPSDLNFTIPDGIESGKYTLAWTWFNRVGNREMYMNCAPVTVEGGASKRSEETTALEKRSNFPGMFVANVNGCTTPYSVDLRFPNPGDNVEYDGDSSNLMKEGTEACTGTPSFGGGSGGSGGGSGSGSGSSPTSTAESSPAVSASLGVSLGLGGGAAPTQASGSDGSGGVFAEASSSESSAPAPTQTAAPAAESSSSSSGSSGSSSSGSSSGASSGSASSGSSSGSSSSSGALSGSCDSEGAWNCIGGSSFQRCASGQWTAEQQMAAGTECNAGQGQNLDVKASLKSRMGSEMRFRKRAHGSHHHA